MSKLAKEVRDTRAYYEKHADIWARTHADSFHDEKEFRVLMQYLPPKASVIDIGCASGTLVPLFLGIGRGLKYHGIDIAKKFIKIAMQRYPQLSFTEGNIADYSTLPKKKFDAFLARSIIMHLPFSEWDTACGNIEKITKPGAHGYLVLPEQRPPSITPQNDPRHFTLLSEKEQIAYMKNRGWKILKKFKHAAGPYKAQWIGYIVQLPA